MFGGIETGEGMTTNLFWHLLTNPDQLAALRADRALGANAVEELLRLEPAAARVDRYATIDTELDGTAIPRGDLVIVSITAANRDPAAFPDPDAFDITRANARTHLAFAHGPHACVGPPPGQARDAGRPRRGAGRLAGHPARCRRDAAERGHLPQAALAAGPLGLTAGPVAPLPDVARPPLAADAGRRSSPADAGVSRTMM